MFLLAMKLNFVSLKYSSVYDYIYIYSEVMKTVENYVCYTNNGKCSFNVKAVRRHTTVRLGLVCCSKFGVVKIF